MKKAAVVFSAAAVMTMTAISVPTPAEARGGWGWGPGIAGGLLAGALIGGLASSAYGYGPGYGYYGPGYGYYGGYAPGYYGCLCQIITGSAKPKSNVSSLTSRDHMAGRVSMTGASSAG